VLEDEVEGHVDGIIYRPVGSVSKLQGVQEWVSTRCSNYFITTEVRAMGL